MTDIQQGEAAPVPRRITGPRLVLASVSALLGMALAVAALLIAGWRPVPVLRYEVAVYFEKAATPERWDAVRAEMSRLPHDEEPRVRTAQENYARVAELYAEDGDPVPDTVTPEKAEPSLVLVTSGRSFDCSLHAGLEKIAGVRLVLIGEFLDGGPMATFEC